MIRESKGWERLKRLEGFHRLTKRTWGRNRFGIFQTHFETNTGFIELNYKILQLDKGTFVFNT